MSSRPSNFPTTDRRAHGGKAQIFRLTEMLTWPPPEWLIEGLIPKGAMSGIYGQPGTGKSLLALDWALCVATGQPWLGRPSAKGYVLYVAAEGHSGQAKRSQAWLAHHGLDARQVGDFGLVKERIVMADASTDYDILFERLRDELERDPDFVIIDTLARTIDGDENESTAMANFLNGAERWINDYGATVLVVHHGNAAGTRERGHTSFKGALGALLKLSRHQKLPDTFVLHTDKQRDAREADDIGLRHCPVEGTESVVFEEADLPLRTSGERAEPKLATKAVLKVIGAADRRMTFAELKFATGLDKDSLMNRLRRLRRDGIVDQDKFGRYGLTPTCL